MDNNVNKLSNEKWSSEIDQIFLDQASPYELKCYHNRYHLAWERAVAPAMVLEKLKLRSLPFLVVDAATGSGAGAAYLYEQLSWIDSTAQVIGIDLDPDAIAYATEHYAHSRLRFVRGDIVQVLKGLRPHVVVSMETLEHISQEAMRDFLQTVSEQLNPGGKAIFSSPRLRPRESTVKRPGHINEMYFQQFRYTLGEYFPMVEFYGFDRYGNIGPEDPSCNLQVGIASKWHQTTVFRKPS